MNCSADMGISSALISAPSMLSTRAFSAAFLISAALLSASDSVDRRLVAALISALSVVPVLDELVDCAPLVGVFVASVTLLSAVTDREEIVGIIGAMDVSVVVRLFFVSCICA